MNASEPEARRGPLWHVPLLVLLGLPVFFWGLGSYSVVNGDEGFYHTVAARMVRSGNWFRLDFPGVDTTYDTFMNSPSHYWLRALLIAVFGDGRWTMRALSGAFGLLTVLAVYRLARTVAPTRSQAPALLAALIQLTTFQFVYLHSARTGELDTIVSFLITASALAFLRAVRCDKSFVPHHLCLAFMLTVKLPIIIMPVAIELALFASTRALRPHFRRYVLSALIVVPLGLAWHVLQAAFGWEEFVDVATQMGGEAAGTVGTVGARAGTLLENVAWHGRNALFGAFPWSLAMVPAFGAALFKRHADDDERILWRTLTFFALGVWVFFAFVSKRFPWYILPTFPFLAACAGAWIVRLGDARRGRRLSAVLAAAGVGAMLLWRSVPIDGFRPLTSRAPLVPMIVGWRRVPGLDRVLGVVLAFVLLAVVLLWLRHVGKERFGVWLASALVVALLPLAALRIAVPLGSLEHTSPLEEFFGRVEERRIAGRPMHFPIYITVPHHDLTTRFYFGRHYVVRRVRDSAAVPHWALNGLR